jgi:gamma-glutamyl phosphate reductase
MKVEQTCAEAQRASRALAGLSRARKDEVLFAVADALRRRSAEILAENDEDVRLARENRLADALVDRLLLDEDRLRDVEAAVSDVAALPDPVGQLVDGWRLDNGVELRKVRVPLGVIAVIYEASSCAAAAPRCTPTASWRRSCREPSSRRACRVRPSRTSGLTARNSPNCSSSAGTSTS